MRAASVLTALCLLAIGPGVAQAGVVAGSVRAAVSSVRIADAGPVVVYLERVEGSSARAGPLAHVHQRHARFQPNFLVVTVGQTVQMSNDDTIYHNVFSYSPSNGFDLGLYPGGESRSITFEHPGVVRTYCSIHENMKGTIFVAPTPFFSRLERDGSFRIAGVPAGRWRLQTWAEKLPSWDREIVVPRAGKIAVEVVLGFSAGGRAAGGQSRTAPERKRSVSLAGTAGLTR
jgi:plastocyanin